MAQLPLLLLLAIDDGGCCSAMGDGKRRRKKMTCGARALVIVEGGHQIRGMGILVFSGTPNSEKRLVELL
jgi:hypothetical protein